jgi:hypothetical protein
MQKSFFLFSRLPEEYLRYINKILTKLKILRISLSIKKYHFAYLNIKLLDYYISRLKYIIKNKRV